MGYHWDPGCVVILLGLTAWYSQRVYTSMMTKARTLHSISDSSYMLGYIDYYWCFNYVDIEKEWTRDIKRDVGIMTRTISDVGKRGNDSEKIIELTWDFFGHGRFLWP